MLQDYWLLLKKPALILEQRIEAYHASRLVPRQIWATIHHVVGIVAAAYDCVSDMMEYIDAMVYYADMYYRDDDGWIIRVPLTGDCAYAANDIENIEKTAIKCIDIIENHNKPK